MSETISRPYTFVKDGVFYFSRRIPLELRQQYTSPRITYSLRTKSPRIAEARARKAADQLDEYWYHLRCQVTDLPGKHMLRLQAVRHARPGVACGADTHLQQEFEAAFPYVETGDQLRAIGYNV